MSIIYYIIDKTFSIWQHLGFHITNNHFYQPIPDTRYLKDDLWNNYSDLKGIDINEKEQLDLLSLFISKYKNEYDQFPNNKTPNPYEYYLNNSAFCSVDGEILYCMIRHFKPKTIVEIGSGLTTLLSAQAIMKNKEEDNNYNCDLIAIEPYPNEILKTGFPGLSKLIIKKLEDMPLSEFEKLGENDILFIDSSHVIKIGNDVYIEYLKILPNLKKGVIVHVHDIFLPAEYPKTWVLKNHRFWNEQYLLQLFLMFNDNFKVLWAASYIHIRHPELLQNAFISYDINTTWPGSFWMRKIE